MVEFGQQKEATANGGEAKAQKQTENRRHYGR